MCLFQISFSTSSLAAHPLHFNVQREYDYLCWGQTVMTGHSLSTSNSSSSKRQTTQTDNTQTF